MFGDHSKYFDPSKPKPVAHVEHRAPLQALKPNNGARTADQAGQKRKARFDSGEDTMPTTRAQKKRKTEESMAKPASRLSRKPKKVVPPRALFSPSPPPETPEKTAASASASKKRKATDEPAEPAGRVSKKTKTAEVTSAPISPSPQPADSEKKDDGADDAAASAASPARQSATGEPDLATTTADHSSENADEGLDGAAASTASPESAPTTEESAVATTTAPTSSENAGDSGSSTPLSDTSAANEKMKKKTKSQFIGRDKIDLNSKSVARTVKKKTGSKGKESKESGKGTARSRIFKPKRVNLNGLTNHRNACFANVIIQWLDAALHDHNIDHLLGELDEELEQFDLTQKECRRFDIGGDIVQGKLLKKLKAMVAAIKKAAKDGDTDKISVSKHLRFVLEELRQQLPGRSDRYISPLILQKVMAYCDAVDADRADNDLSVRQEMSGDTQQDAFLYSQLVLHTLIADPHTRNAKALRALFEIQTATQDLCSTKGCDHQSDARTATSTYHDINVPAKPAGEAVEFRDLFGASYNSAKEDDACPTCGNKSLYTHTRFTKIPDCLQIKVNRTAYDQATQKSSKVETFVNLPQAIKIKGEKFELHAVIRHKGSQATSGHYTMFRRFEDGWNLLDDKDCDKVAAEDVKDHGRSGKSAMLLFKRVKA